MRGRRTEKENKTRRLRLPRGKHKLHSLMRGVVGVRLSRTNVGVANLVTKRKGAWE